jgi:hypothetical protein
MAHKWKDMTDTIVYQQKYAKSWALVIGINEYRHASPLAHARNDATVVAELLKARFAFASDAVTLLLDQQASKEAIVASFLAYADGNVGHDDRLLVFFAGHGYTRAGRRGEVGYLIPQDGDPANAATLVRWDDLTRNAELIPAKHILFVMDACYGGLAVTRSLAPGSNRFLKDMLQRYSRQVLTAGKADEVVADGNGPRPNHSIFSGHLLNALEGAAASSDGVISANAVMAYVYDRVSRDPSSRQSPHYGFLEGDGDLIFAAPTLDDLSLDLTVDNDIMIQVPAIPSPPDDSLIKRSLSDQVKEYVADPRFRIRLDDLVAHEIRSALHETRAELFPNHTKTVTPADFATRLRGYERALNRLVLTTILLSRWGAAESQPMLQRVAARIADTNGPESGLTVWLGLRWYPLTLLLYSGGIAALSAHNYTNLATLLTTRVGRRVTGGESHEAIVEAARGMLDVKRTNIFKSLPGHEQHYTPESEYLFKVVQPELEDLLFLGSSYEDLFDRYEILQALVFADLTQESAGRVWGPIGRFGWKHRGRSLSPYSELLAEADREGAKWPPLRAGLFKGSAERFQKIAVDYKESLDRLPWY